MKTTKSIAAYAMILGTLLATNLVQTAHAGGIRKSSTKIAHRTQFDVAGHLLVESSGMRKGSATRRGMYCDRGKSSPKIAHGMRKNVLRHEIELAFQRGDFGLAFELIHELDGVDLSGADLEF